MLEIAFTVWWLDNQPQRSILSKARIDRSPGCALRASPYVRSEVWFQSCSITWRHGEMISAGHFITGGFLKWGYPKIDGLFHGKSHLEMDDNWGTPISWKPPTGVRDLICKMMCFEASWNGATSHRHGGVVGFPYFLGSNVLANPLRAQS